MIRALARAAACLLPSRVKSALALWRFGHGAGGHRFQIVRDREGDLVRFAIDGRLRFTTPLDAVNSVEYHFVRDGDSCDEMDGFLAVSSAAPADGLLLDIGAHIGLFAVVHLALGPAHRAVLFEPSPPLSAAAAEWLRLNGMAPRGDVRCVGVGRGVETRLIETDALGFARDAVDPSAAIAVPFTSIDHVCHTEGLHPAIIKIDVEGHEADVIAGAADTLRRERPILCLELHLDMLEQSGGRLETILHTLHDADYECRKTDGTRISAAQLRHSLKAIMRVTAYPRERS